MKVTNFTREALAARREARTMKAAGYQRIDVDRSVTTKPGVGLWAIADVKISVTGKSVWCKLAEYP